MPRRSIWEGHMTASLEQAILHELERAHPAPVTRRSLRSLVANDEYTREDIHQTLAQLEAEKKITQIKEPGMIRYRLSDAAN